MPLEVGGDLIRTAQVEGGDALERVISLVWDEAYRVSASILRDHGLAQDAAQDACVAILRGLTHLRDVGAFKTWSYKIIVSRAVSVARRRRDLQPLEVLDTQEVRFESEDALDLADALSALPVAQRGAVILHYCVGLTSREIAESTGLPSSTIRFHLMRARRTLRAALSHDQTPARPTPSHPEVYTDAH